MESSGGWYKGNQDRKSRRKKKRKKKLGRREKKKEKTMKVKKVVEEWEIWDKEEAAAKSEVEAKKMVPEKYHQWIKVF